ncbi:MAG: hypothetical protein KDN20_16795 [Verrucomicrobiae bacterium]|nr:hypothetical protein [Verrucomicrobiae bacterium]
MRAIDKIAPRLKEGGVVRKINVDRDQKRVSVGIDYARRSIQAFGGLLYSAGAVSHSLFTEGSDIAHQGQNSRLDVGDMSFLDAETRIDWKCLGATYDLLEEVFESDDLPNLVLISCPFVLGLQVYPHVIDEHDEAKLDVYLKREMESLKEKIDAFWAKNRRRCFPYDKAGPKVVSVHSGRLSEPLRALQGQGTMVSPDGVDPEIANHMRTDWVEIISVGLERLLLGILTPFHRTAAFERDYARLDERAFPQEIKESGTIAFHYLSGLRSQPVHAETLGNSDDWKEHGGAEALDALAGDLMALTFFDHKKALPLPLWYAREAVQTVKKKGVLEFYKREALRAMQEEQVDRAWLTGWEGE